MASYIKSDLEFILAQIRIAEAHASGQSLSDLIPNTELPFGLRTLNGSFNNLLAGQSGFGAADLPFPHLAPASYRDDADGDSFDANGPAPGGLVTNTDYAVSGNVADADPRIISNLIVDMTANNPAAVAAAAGNEGSALVSGTRADGTPFETFYIPNTAPDEGLSAPFNSWMTFFGQFFDHGLDLVNKGGSGTVFIPLQPDDPLYVEGSPTNFMVVTRANVDPGPDGLLGTDDDVRDATNQTSPFVDQNQTYSSHPSHQVFLRAYELDGDGKPVSTGKLIVNRDLGADGRFGGVDADADTELGGMATWAVVKAQARDLLGINLTDTDILNVPLLATDQYGMFIRGPNGYPQVVMAGDVLVEGDPTANGGLGISLAGAVRTGHAFLDDIAHTAAPVNGQTGAALTADADGVAGGAVAAGFYDNELLDAHFIAGDGRVNENIGLTAVHHIFHSEHNRLVEHTKSVILASGDLDFLNEWLLTPVGAIPGDPSGLVWNGERLFQAAKFGTEMQYQHIVFEEFARTIQPQVDAFLDFDDTVNPAIFAEFAHTVYRFGHSMLTETIDRLDPNFASSEIGLIQAFLNPLEFNQNGTLTPEEAAGAIVRGLTRQVGNEIDEFVTEALRNNLVGLPLDLAAINLARGRETGVPTLNAARREFFEGTGDSQLRPYTSWSDFVQHMKHPESLINFIAAYGTHESITSVDTVAEKRAAASLIVLGGDGEPGDRLDFLMSTGVWASGPNGVTITGLDNVDLWIGGLAEAKMPFGGMLGSTFNFVFETQLEALQDGDRLYYLHRTAGLNFLSELENNSFAKLVMLNSNATHLPGLIFSTPGFILEVDQTKQFTGLNEAGADGIQGDDPSTPLVDEGADDEVGADGIAGNSDPLGGNAFTPLVIRDNPATVGGDSDYLQYTGDEHVVLGGTEGNDILIASIGDDTIYGDGGNDRIEGGHGNDMIEAGAGDDIITDIGGDDVLKGDTGNDVMHGGAGLNLFIGGPGSDFIITGEDIGEVIAGEGNDFILGSRFNIQMAGNEGDDWIEIGSQDGAPGDNFDPLGLDQIVGHDVFRGDGGFDEMIGEGGDDVFVGSSGPDKYKGMSGFDWVTYKESQSGVNVDFFARAFNEAPLPASLASTTAKYAMVEGLSGSTNADILRGDSADAAQIATAGFTGSVLNQAGIDLVAGLQAFLDNSLGGPVTSFGSGEIMLGGDGSDIIEGRGGDDLIDGDKWLNVQIAVHENTDGTGAVLRRVDSLTELVADMLSGAVNPGQLVVERTINDSIGAFDTAVFSDLFANYTISTDLNGVTTVTHNIIDPDTLLPVGIGVDGIDRLTNVERLQFADQSLTLSGANNDPAGLLTISNPDPSTFEVLTVSAAGVTDADNPNGGVLTGPISYIWQVETVAGTGIFADIGTLAGDGVASAVGPSFTVTPDLAGLNLRVKAIYQDATGVLETVFSAPTSAVAEGVAPDAPAPLPEESATTSPGMHLIRSDLQFILDQIVVAERDAAGEDLLSLLPNPRVPFGLRTVDGTYNNLLQGQQEFGAADNVFPRLTTPVFNDAEDVSIDLDGGGPLQVGDPTSYQQTSGFVFDSQPRLISNLIVDQTMNNPAAVEVAAGTPGAVLVDGTRADGTPFQTWFIPNQAPDEGLSAGFNTWMTFFGQFFDHGLDLVTKGGSGTVFIPLQPDDPLYVEGSPTNFMVMTRATNQPGPDGILGNDDDIHEHSNTTSPFVDQNQTYSSHPSHQVFLRAYEFNALGEPVATGELIVNRDLGLDGIYGTEDDEVIGGMATWAVVKAQARDILGIELTDADVFNVPLLATDAYGNFLKGPNGFPQVVIRTGNGDDGIAGNADDTTTLVEGDPLNPVDLTNAVRTGHAFLDDIAHFAVPSAGLTPDVDTVAGGPPPDAGTYDNELLDAHYIAGDGRVNENIGLTAVHHIFHAEHNRMVGHTKDVVLASNDVAFLNQWLLTPVLAMPADQAAIDSLVWNGERLFQAAKFTTEMEYQHLVFEEFARTIQPNIDPFIGPTQNYQADIDASIVAEFAHTVYRFGHSMLTETIDRLDPNFASSEIGLIQAFLNPLEFNQNGTLTPDEAAGAIIRGLTRQTGNEIDEFVTEALRNNLVGLPLDLAAINLARGRDTGIPSLNAVRRDIYEQTGDALLKPYTSWNDFAQHVKHAASVINFIAAYGTHAQLQAADVDTLAEKRAVATALVFGGDAVITIDPDLGTTRTFTADDADRLAFLNSEGAYANVPLTGVTTTGVDAIDLWIGGLAEAITPFGGMLGSTFNFVFENQLEALQNADRFYYLDRTAGLNFVTELENNSFAKMVMANTNATHLPAVMFLTALYLEVDPTKQFNAELGFADPVGDSALTPLVIRDNPDTVGPDSNYLQYTGGDHAVLGGTDGNDILIGSIGDDTFWGDGGNDRIEGGHGNDNIRGGAGDDIITDMGGDDNIQGDDGNDVIHAGNGINLILGGFGKDFIVTGEDSSEAFGGTGDDFILGSNANEQSMGNEGDDWLEQGNLDGSPGDNFDPFGQDLVKGNDVYIGSGQPDIMNGEGGDDIMVGSSGPGDKYLGASGFDWATFKDNTEGVSIDMTLIALNAAPVPAAAGVAARFAQVEGLSGSAHSDVLRGDHADAGVIATAGAQGSLLTNLDLIAGLRELLGDLAAGDDLLQNTADDQFGSGNILLGGKGSDLLEGRGGDDVIEGDAWLNVRIAVHANNDGSGPEIDSYDSMVPLVPLMLNGTYNPGQLVITREILSDSAEFNFDTAVFSDISSNYEIEGAFGEIAGSDLNGDGFITIVHNVLGELGIDGTDQLRNIERLQFNDRSVVLVNGINAEATGLLTVSDTTPEVGTLVSVSAAGIFDADNVATGGAVSGAVSYFWQVETIPDSGLFDDIVLLTGLGEEPVTGPSFTITPELDGLVLRVRGVYEDQNGVLETVFSAPTAPVNPNSVNDAPVGAVLVSDTTPTEGQQLTAIDAFTDPDGIGVVNHQWQVQNGGGFINIAGATAATFTPTQAQVGLQLRVVASYTDLGGTPQQFISAPTTVVGDLVTGTEGNDTLSGTAGEDSLNGLGGNDVLNGGLGADTMSGDNGNDVYYVDNVGDVVIETNSVLATGGSDLVVTNIDYTLGANVENLWILTSASANGMGNGLDNTLYAGAGDNVLNGGAGLDRVSFAYATSGVTVSLAVAGAQATGGSGSDTLIGIERLNGSNFADNLTGDAGANILSGGLGADTMSGGDGNDTYYVDNVGDMVVESNSVLATGGSDLVITSIDYTLGADVENLWIEASGAVNGTGNGLNNALYAGAGNNVLNGGAGIDTVSYAYATSGVTVSLAVAGAQATSGSGSDTLIGIERLNGSNFADSLTGDAGANVLNGSVGADTMSGGDGNDVYYVDNAGDVVIETNSVLATGGSDLVVTSINYTLGANVENLWIVANGAANGTGNGLNNTFYAGGGNNVLNGGAGIDTISYAYAVSGVTVSLAIAGAQATGGSGSDTLIGIEHLNGSNFADNLTGDAASNVLNGGLGADILNGGLGADTMFGGDGNDAYYVDDVGDVVIETNSVLATGGSDIVVTSIDYTLGANVENLWILTNAAANGTGNGLNNTLYAGAGNNVLNGGAGLDTVSFAYATSSVTVSLAVAGAQATGGSGSDTLIGIERLNGSNFADNLTGDAAVNVLNGGLDDDFINGGAGNDTMLGGLGNDTFVFSAAGFGADRIMDFDADPAGGGQDLLDISGLGITAGSFAGSVAISDLGADTLVTFGGDSIRLVGIADPASITQADFILA